MVFVIAPVRSASPGLIARLEKYASNLEANGIDVYLPHRDTNQTMSGLEICAANMAAIGLADEVHLFYDPSSQGTHFDLGVAFALGKRLVVVECPKPGPGKSFPRMVREWQTLSPNRRISLLETARACRRAKEGR